MDSTSLTHKPIPLLLRQLAIPSSLGMLFNTLYNIVDTYYAGLISTEALAALSASSFLFFFIIGMAYGGTSALTALIGHAYGKQHFFLASIIAKKGVALVVSMGIFLGFFGFCFASELLTWIGTEERYHALALHYIEVILLGTSFFFTNFALNSVLFATGDTKSYRNTLIFGFFANILLNPLFIYGWGFIPAMGIGGIAFATVLVQVMNAGYLLYKSLKTGLIGFTCKAHFYPDRRIYKTFFTQATPPGLNMLMMSFGSLIALHFVTLYGYQAVAGYGIGYRVEQLMLLPSLGISSAVLSLVSNNMGAGKFERVRQTLLYALAYGYTLSFIGMGILWVGGKWLVAQFDTNVEVVQYGTTYIYVMLFLFCAYVTHFSCVATLQGIKKPPMIFYIGFFRQILAPVITYTLIVNYFELSFMWMWVGLGCIVYSSALFLLYYTFKHLPQRPMAKA
ncbi:MATE family efflux transporter [Sulfurospirillum barnesii]|uniref:Putative efflux protein, MATE family n=1 Tax=Sulfurospirillum barnesii (strain ATCC 700032 / DSM 10660 / SES-3) TaxID=760154 RepID=I3XUU2_SULBS|nr:MATE family efflux transporter [Sulfurospirillum barnesii]AFL67716.1 putative efflux protein, MATE family [Sulfurospirillum barnesii SES-3]